MGEGEGEGDGEGDGSGDGDGEAEGEGEGEGGSTPNPLSTRACSRRPMSSIQPSEGDGEGEGDDCEGPFGYSYDDIPINNDSYVCGQATADEYCKSIGGIGVLNHDYGGSLCQTIYRGG